MFMSVFFFLYPVDDDDDDDDCNSLSHTSFSPRRKTNMARRSKTWAAEMATTVVGLLIMAQLTTQQDFSRPLSGHTQSMTKHPTSVFGVIVTSTVSELALNKSSLFKATSYVDVLGRRFVRGTIDGSNVVFVRSAGSPSLHVAVTLQIMAANFNLRGIIYYGSAGATNHTLKIGTVHVPARIAFTGSWDWLSKDSNTKGQLNIREFNDDPLKGENLLGSIEFNDIDVYDERTLGKRFWLPVSREFLSYAAKIQEAESKENCIIQSNCLIPHYDVVVGLNASSSDIYVNNPAYAEFLYKSFRVSTVDKSAIAVALGARLNNLPYIVLHGISNKAGAGNPTGATTVANINAANAAALFIRLVAAAGVAAY